MKNKINIRVFIINNEYCKLQKSQSRFTNRKNLNYPLIFLLQFCKHKKSCKY